MRWWQQDGRPKQRHPTQHAPRPASGQVTTTRRLGTGPAVNCSRFAQHANRACCHAFRYEDYTLLETQSRPNPNQILAHPPFPMPAHLGRARRPDPSQGDGPASSIAKNCFPQAWTLEAEAHVKRHGPIDGPPGRLANACTVLKRSLLQT